MFLGEVEGGVHSAEVTLPADFSCYDREEGEVWFLNVLFNAIFRWEVTCSVLTVVKIVVLS